MKGIDQIAYSPSELEDIKKIKRFFNGVDPKSSRNDITSA
jgi:hypothetical protein